MGEGAKIFLVASSIGGGCALVVALAIFFAARRRI